MYRNYEEYEKCFEEMQKKAPKSINLRKQTPEEFASENYRDKIEWYLVEEWNTDFFHNIFFGNCPENYSDEITPEEQRADELHGRVCDIIWEGWEKGWDVPKTARAVFVYLISEKAIEQES